MTSEIITQVSMLVLLRRVTFSLVGVILKSNNKLKTCNNLRHVERDVLSISGRARVRID